MEQRRLLLLLLLGASESEISVDSARKQPSQNSSESMLGSKRLDDVQSQHQMRCTRVKREKRKGVVDVDIAAVFSVANIKRESSSVLYTVE